MKHFLTTIHLKNGAVLTKKQENSWLKDDGVPMWIDAAGRPVAPFITMTQNKFSAEALTVNTEDISAFHQKEVIE